MDEVLNFIIAAYPDDTLKELIQIKLSLDKTGTVQVSVSNAGPPVHLDRIPRFEPSAPTESNLDGLWYFLAKNFVDHLEFRNLGMDGWQAVLERRLSAASFEPRKADSEGSIDEEIAQFEVRPGRHDDAAELVDLTYDTYGYSYTGPDFYHPSNLSHHLASGEIVSIVATADGVIVGNTSISYPPETPCCAYLGALMVKRSYRRSKAIELMISETVAPAIGNRP